MKLSHLFVFLAGLIAGALLHWGIFGRTGSAPVAANGLPPSTSGAGKTDVSKSVAGEAWGANWAEHQRGAGLNNFYRVSKDLYRGEQPTAEGFKTLKAQGVKTIVNLRLLKSDRDETGEAGLEYEHIWFDPLHPEDEDMVKFLKIAGDAKRQPVFVHCRHGSDRTGTMCALYRIVIQGWDKEEAIKEMRHGDFGFHDDYFQNLVEYLRKLDVESMRKQAGSSGR